MILTFPVPAGLAGSPITSPSITRKVLRGLGYWFFYGGDKISPWIEPSVRYTQDLWLIAASYALPILAFTAAYPLVTTVTKGTASQNKFIQTASGRRTVRVRATRSSSRSRSALG